MPVRSAPLQRRPPEPRTPLSGAAGDPRAALTKWAEVDAAALRDNARALRAHLGDDVALLVMVKANGYGHGTLTAARAALAGGATWLGVSCAEEALALRADGVEAPLLVTGWSNPRAIPALVAAGVDVTVYDVDTLEAALAGARASRRTASIHLKVDTGMGRLGAAPDDVRDLCRRLGASRSAARLRGVFTHFASAESDEEFTAQQHARFLVALDVALQSAPDALVHAANSAAVLLHPRTWHDLVRVGIAFYGYAPVRTDIPLRTAMTVVARVTQVRTVTRGDSAGYGRTWIAPGAARIATVAAGYADGVLRALGNRGALLLRGVRVPIVGRVSMDQVTADVSDVEDVRPGDEAVYLGVRDGATLDADDVAAMAGTIPNDVLCAISSRVPRIVTGE